LFHVRFLFLPTCVQKRLWVPKFKMLQALFENFMLKKQDNMQIRQPKK
jgi:hypothetical protein